MDDFFTLTIILSLFTFTMTTTLSPGPNNILVLSSGLTYGYKKTIPHMLGVIIGFPLMVILIGLGAGIVFEKYPFVLDVLKYLGILYLLWMAYKIVSATNNYEINEETSSKPFTFIQSALFQWVNPKAWIMGMTVISIYVNTQEESFYQILIIACMYFFTTLIGMNIWVGGGVFLKRFISNARFVKNLNRGLAFTLILSILPVLFN
ncbi:MAG: lysine transporter LysE [Arcobacter sp.]|nr:MAG: lysine transporter LysE [Arcobacter sp.]